MIPVNVEGDTIMIHALFKGDCFDKAYTLRIYVEYEETEILVTEQEEENDRKRLYSGTSRDSFMTEQLIVQFIPERVRQLGFIDYHLRYRDIMIDKQSSVEHHGLQ